MYTNIIYLISKYADIITKYRMKLSSKDLSQMITLPEWYEVGIHTCSYSSHPEFYSSYPTLFADAISFKTIAKQNWTFFSFNYWGTCVMMRYIIQELDDGNVRGEVEIALDCGINGREFYTSLWLRKPSHKYGADDVKKVISEKHHHQLVKEIPKAENYYIAFCFQ